MLETGNKAIWLARWNNFDESNVCWAEVDFYVLGWRENEAT